MVSRCEIVTVIRYWLALLGALSVIVKLHNARRFVSSSIVITTWSMLCQKLV